jgi:structural maintenance of chromosome 2
MLEEFPWIDKEKQFFGQEDHIFNFKNMDISGLRDKVKKLKSVIEEKKKRVNFKVNMMYDDTLQQYDRLISKKETIERNKLEVEETITFLNEKKNEELEKTWRIVNKNMMEIFSTLLPGAMAKLSLHDEVAGVEKGLDLKVGFNNSWKQSLSELSGG